MYGTIAAQLLKEGDRGAALTVLERIYALVTRAQTSKRRQDVLFQLAYAQAAAGELQAAASTAAQLAPGQQREGVMMVIAMERTKQGDPSDALPDVLGLSFVPWRNGALRVIADALAARGNYVQALATLDKSQGAGERAYGLSELALEQAKNGDPAAGLTVELAGEAALKGGSETKPYVFGQIAVARAVLGDFTGALGIISQMEDSAKVWPLWNLTEMLVRAGNEPEAITLAESQAAPHPKACALLAIATALIDKQREASRKIADATK